MTTLYGYVSNIGTPEYDDILNSDLPKEEKVKQIQMRGQAYRDEIDRNKWKDYARMGLGTAISAASFHPILNIPYVGTGLGGAMYELGQGMVEGDKLPEILKRTGQGFAVGETVGAVPYVGKLAGKTKAGQAVGERIGNIASKIAETPAWQKIEDALMTDVTGNWIKGYHGTPYEGKIKKFVYDPKKQTGTDYGEAYYFTNNFDNASGYGYDVYKDPEIANIQTQQNLIKQKIINAADIDDWDAVNKLSEQHKINNDKIFNIMQNGTAEKTGGQVIKANLDFKNPYIADAEGKNYYNVYDKYFEDARKAGNDSIIVKNVVDSARGLKPSDVYIAFKPEQIKNSNLVDYLANDSVLTKGYRENKTKIDNTVKDFVETQKRKADIADLVSKRKDWGIAYTKASGNPELAIETLLREKKGFVPKAFYKEGIGDIDLVWGEHNYETDLGYGLEHILARRSKQGIDAEQFVRELPDTIKNGVITKDPRFPTRRYIEDVNKKISIELDWNKKRRKWIVTAFRQNKSAKKH